MYRYIIRRIIEMVPLVLAIAVVNFIIIHVAPGDPALLLAGEQASPEYVAQVREEFALDKPLHEQLLAYLGRLLRGDLGRSVRTACRGRFPGESRCRGGKSRPGDSALRFR